jgi:hypothetical protein
VKLDIKQEDKNSEKKEEKPQVQQEDKNSVKKEEKP